MVNIVEVAKARNLARSGEARRVREAGGLSLSEVARQVGVTPKTVSRWELGECSPRGEVAVRYGKFLARLQRRLGSLLEAAG